MDFDKSILSFLKPELVEDILSESKVQAIQKGTEILRENQYVKVLPIVIEGLVKVYSRFDEKELLLYRAGSELRHDILCRLAEYSQ